MLLHEIQKTLPQKTGVYLFLNKKGEALYVGKAKNIRNRTAYYFRAENIPLRLKRMVQNATELKYYVTETENDAFLLEAQLIKEKKPTYNILYRNGRPLHYINFSAHAFPRIEIIKNWTPTSIGPFLSAEQIRNLLDELLPVFNLRTCTDYVFSKRKRPCLEFFAKRCSAPCVGMIQQEPYAKNVSELMKFFQGQTKNIVKQWQTDLKKAVKEENFELAAKKRDQLASIEKLNQKQNIYFENIEKLDIIAHHKNYFYIEFIRKGGVSNIEYRKYEKPITLAEFIWDFYNDDPQHRIIGPEITSAPFASYSSKLSGLEKKIMLQTQKRMKSLITEEQNKQSWALLLGIDELNDIEVYDSSHYAGKHALCGMVCYQNDEWVKERYRTWKMPHDSRNDTAILEASLERRIKQLNLPSMILLDGGVGQLNTAIKVFKKHNLPLNILIAFAKGENRKGGVVYNQDGIVNIQDKNLMMLLEKLRDEAHRWAHKNASQAFTKTFGAKK